jgi:hypothetical protein
VIRESYRLELDCAYCNTTAAWWDRESRFAARNDAHAAGWRMLWFTVSGAEQTERLPVCPSCAAARAWLPSPTRGAD